MSEKELNLITEFMMRADLKGREVPAFNEAMAAIHRELGALSLKESDK